MARTALAQQLREVSSLIQAKPESVLWSGKLLDGLHEELAQLPVMLPDGTQYQLTARNRVLTIAAVGQSGISAFRLVPKLAATLSIEMSEAGTELTGFRSKLFDRIVLSKSPLALDPGAISAAHTAAPLALLDEYADLRWQSKQRGLSADQTRRMTEIVSLLARHFERCKRSKATPSNRSTPQSAGESREASNYGRAG